MTMNTEASAMIERIVPAMPYMYQVEAKQDVLASSKRELEEEKELLQRGKKEAAAETDILERRREVCMTPSRVPFFGRKSRDVCMTPSLVYPFWGV